MQTEPQPSASARRRKLGLSWAIALGTLVLLGIVLPAGRSGQWSLAMGAPHVTMIEAHARRPGGPTFDHRLLNELLRDHVVDGGWVNYDGLRSDRDKLDAYIEVLAKAPFDALGRDEKLALLINAYNAFTLKLILDHDPAGSIKDIPSDKRWRDRRWWIGPTVFSLNEIEHQQIRPMFAEPRIHFALVCAAIGCPPLRREAYVAARLEEQLEDQARYVHSHDRWLRMDAATTSIHLTKLYKWYRSDFEQFADSILHYAARFSPQVLSALHAPDTPKVRWLSYDWTLNDRKNRNQARSRAAP